MGVVAHLVRKAEMTDVAAISSGDAVELVVERGGAAALRGIGASAAFRFAGQRP
jgi:hypothetical protein